MSKRGGGRPFGPNYYEHDNRDVAPRRSVSFKHVRGGSLSSVGGVRPHGRGRSSQPQWNKLIRNHIQSDADVDMGGSGRPNNFNNGGDRRPKMRFPPKFRGRGGRQNSPAPVPRFLYLQPSSTFWYKVIVLHGGRYDRKWIIDSLNAGIAPQTFTPVATSGKDAIFYIDDHRIAQRLQKLHQKLSTEDGYKLGVIVKHYNNNEVRVDDSLKEVLKMVMGKRFRQETRALDLSQFHMDTDLSVADKFVPLNQKSILSATLSLVADNCPTLHALDLSKNHISTLEGLKQFFARLPNLRILYLASNQMSHISSLDSLKGLGIEELLMDSNPVCAKYADQGAYITDVRKRLPKLLKLDGVVLPPPILFDVETAQLPRSRGSYLCAEQGKEIAREFLEQYYGLYDSPNREALRVAYHEKAMLSVTCNYPQGSNQGHANRDKAINRNLKRVPDLERRMRLLMHGHDEIMKLLCNFPNTQHDPHSFAVDLLLFTPQLIQLCVCGVFRESGSSNIPMRAFSRSLIIVPQGAGFCIVNETLTMSNATNAQSNAAFKTSLVPVAPAPVIAPAVVPLMPVPVSPSVGVVDSRRQMIEHVARTSGMNLAWSEKCLEESKWDLEVALRAFSQLHAVGSIPQEAFTH